MNLKERREAKEQARIRCDALREELQQRLLRPSRLPDRVINGSAQAAQEFKALAEKTGKKYHVLCAPGKSLTLAKLQAVEAKLAAVLASIK